MPPIAKGFEESVVRSIENQEGSVAKSVAIDHARLLQAPRPVGEALTKEKMAIDLDAGIHTLREKIDKLLHDRRAAKLFLADTIAKLPPSM